MINIIEGVTRKLQRNAQWVGTMPLEDVKEGMIVKPAQYTYGADLGVADGVVSTDKLLYLVLTNGNRGDVTIAGLTVIGGAENITFEMDDEVSNASGVLGLTPNTGVRYESEAFVACAAGEPIQFMVERSTATSVTLAYAPGGFGTA